MFTYWDKTDKPNRFSVQLLGSSFRIAVHCGICITAIHPHHGLQEPNHAWEAMGKPNMCLIQVHRDTVSISVMIKNYILVS